MKHHARHAEIILKKTVYGLRSETLMLIYDEIYLVFVNFFVNILSDKYMNNFCINVMYNSLTHAYEKLHFNKKEKLYVGAACYSQHLLVPFPLDCTRENMDHVTYGVL